MGLFDHLGAFLIYLFIFFKKGKHCIILFPIISVFQYFRLNIVNLDAMNVEVRK